MTQVRQLFGVNILSQFVLSITLLFVGDQLPPGLNGIVDLGGLILLALSLFGIIYAFFRLFGVRSEGCENLYQHFPFGLLSLETHQPPLFGGTALETYQPPFGGMVIEDSRKDAAMLNETDTFATPSWDWKRLCSFKTLRYAGIVLIVTAMFSLLFNIDWTLIARIWTAGLLGILFCGCAEWLKRTNRVQMGSVSSLIGFALLQFTLTLLFLYAAEQGWSPLLQSPHTWLALKFLLSGAFFFTLWRYPSDVHPILFFTIAYASPLTLMHAGAIVAFPMGLVFVAAMSAMVLLWNATIARPSLILLNAAFANAYVGILYSQGTTAGNSVGILALVAYVIFFLAQLIVAVFNPPASTTGPKQLPIEYLHLVAIHTFIILGFLQLQGELWFLQDYLGFAFLAVALVSFAAAMASQKNIANAAFNHMLLNVSILLSAAGLFLQTKDPWSAVVFLIYACLILWYSLYTTSMRTRIYGFIILGVSLVKLYFQFTDIFQSIPGSVAILLIGMTLVALSYKFEALKELVMEGIHLRVEK